MSRNILLIFVVLPILAFSCKKSDNLSVEKKAPQLSAKGYILKDGVCFHKEPKVELPCEKSRTLAPPLELEIIEHNIDPIGNETRKIKFYKAKFNQEIGYISYQEELDKKSFYAIEKWEVSKKAKVNVSSLRFRSLPSLTATNIRPLPKGTQLEILGMGLIKFQADGKYDAWAHVRDSEGVEGFSFAGFLDILEEENFATKDGSVSGESGFVLLKKIPENFISDLKDTSANPTSEELESIEKSSCDKECIPFPYQDKVEKDGRIFYLVNRQFKEYGINYVEDGKLYHGWIDSAFVSAHGNDIFEYTRNQIKDPGVLSLLDYIKSTSGSEMKNAFDFKVLEKISILDDSGAYYVVEYNDHDHFFNASSRGSGVYLLKGDDVKSILTNFDSLKYTDLNQDGIYEWLTSNSGRSDMSYILYGNIHGEMKELIHVNQSEFEGCSYSLNGEDSSVNLQIAEDYSNQKCNLEWGNSNEVLVDHGLGQIRFRFNGEELLSL